jgi:uncharacterized protein
LDKNSRSSIGKETLTALTGRLAVEAWHLSRYTQPVYQSDGEMLLYNAFVGGIVRIPKEKKESTQVVMKTGIRRADLSDELFAELCQNGFFVPSDFDEAEMVKNILEKELRHSFYLIILPNEDCNFRCTYCYEKFLRGRMSPEVISGLSSFVSKKVKEMQYLEIQYLNVAWFGGEPLLSRDIVYNLSKSFMRSCEQHGIFYASDIRNQFQSQNTYFTLI